MSVKLPSIIAEFVQAKNDFQVEAILACLADEAVVEDEGQKLRGTAAIRSWLERTHEQYDDRLEVIGLRSDGSRHIVTAQVSGNFDGSPVPLDFDFLIAAGKISALSITLHDH